MALNPDLRKGLRDQKRDTIPRNRRSVGKGQMGGGCFDAPRGNAQSGRWIVPRVDVGLAVGLVASGC